MHADKCNFFGPGIKANNLSYGKAKHFSSRLIL